MWLSKILTTLFITSLATCTPVGSAPPHITEDAGRHLTTGILTRNNGRPYIRQEIGVLHDTFPDQWNLYVLGLAALQAVDQDDPFSYFRIAGIHGAPFQIWQDAQGVPNAGGRGYCPHNNMLFLPWHRPYLALFEQELYKHIRSIADQASTEAERWRAAADSFRIPYWDWALGEQTTVPEYFLTPTIQVTGPDAVNKTIDNPLYQYRFHPVDSQNFQGKWAQANTTLRWPTSDEPNAPSNQLGFDNYYNSFKRSWRDETSNCYTLSRDFNDFWSKAETLHGKPHYAIGSAKPVNQYEGNMWPVDYSAFDPLFWLHHANVDRILALYQAVHPNNWIEPSNVGFHGNRFIPANTNVDANTQLQPFWKDAESFWSSNDIRDTSIFGYAYPETQSWNYASEPEWQAAVNATIARLYSPSARVTLTSSPQTSNSLAYLLSDNTFTDWQINVEASSLDLPPSFHAHFFLVGDFSSDSSTEVGMWTQLMPMEHDKTARNARRSERKAKRLSSIEKDLQGTVSLTASLLDQIVAGKLQSLDASAVVPFLKVGLTWKVYSGDGTQIPSEDLDGVFSVGVSSRDVRIPTNPDELLKYESEVMPYPEATMGKGGGAAQ